jgi:hypothetical protein
LRTSNMRPASPGSLSHLAGIKMINDYPKQGPRRST